MISLYSGDCLSILNECKDEMPSIDCVVTDPPFNIGYKYNSYSDNMKEDDYYSFLGEILSRFPAKVVIHYPESLYKLAFQLGEFPVKVVSWVYNSNNPRQHRDIAFFGVKPDFRKVGQPYKNPNDPRIKKLIAQGKKARLYDWWNINQVKNVSTEKTEHPAQMPLEVMLNVVGLLPDNYTILDPFMGAGTTGVACKRLNRRFVGIELDEKYFAIATERIFGSGAETPELPGL